jgi:hypothetical protein
VILMPALWLAQLLCPQRHAICALAYDLDETPAAEIEAKLQGVIGPGGLNPWCGLCGSRHLHIEHGKLATDDWEEATAVLRACERSNLATREFFYRSRN